MGVVLSLIFSRGTWLLLIGVRVILTQRGTSLANHTGRCSSQCSEPSGGPTGMAGIMLEDGTGYDRTGLLAVVRSRAHRPGDCRARLGPLGPHVWHF